MAKLRTATRGDIDAVLTFWLYATTEPSTTDDVASVNELIDHAPDALVLAVDGDVIVGTLIVGWDGWRGTMYRLAVAPEHRRHGIASALVAEGERRLGALGAQRLHLIVASDQQPAHRFWRSAGYDSTDQLRFVKRFG